MNVLQILPELNVGGVETGTVDFAKYLTRGGHGAVVVSNGGELVSDLLNAGIKHYQLPVHKKNFLSIITCIKSLARIIKDEKIDIVHARSRVPAWIAFFACRRTKTPFLTTCHGYYGKHFFSRVMGWPKLVIVPSEVIGKYMIDDFGVLPENIRLIPRSVDIEKFTVPRVVKTKPEFRVTIVGRITPLKGHTFFIKAMSKVVRTMPNVKIWVIGDAPRKKEIYKEEIQTLVKRLALSENVEFLGNRKDIPQLLAQTDCLVLSTITEEAFGRVILEAQAAGVPVVATKVGGVVEIIEDGKTGLLVLPKDTDEMARAVLRILKDKKLSDNLVKEARKKLENKFTLKEMADKTIAVYEELLRSMNILIVKISSVGDVVLSTAAIKAIREKFPLAKIHCLVGKDSREIIMRSQDVDETIVFDPKGKDKGIRGLLQYAAKLRALKIDRFIDFQNNRASHILAALSFPLESIGFNNGKFGFLLSKKVKMSKEPMLPVKHQFQLLEPLGIEYSDTIRLNLKSTEDSDRYIKSLLDSQWLGNTKEIVGINIAASERWKTKNWPLEYVARLCDMLAAQNIRVILTGTDKDKDAARELLSLSKSKPADLTGKTNILELASLIKRCMVYLTPDSAPMHIAAAVGAPFIAFFGPTDDRRHLPPAGRFVVIKRQLECMPCYSSICKIKTHACMREILPEDIFKTIESMRAPKKDGP